MRKAMDRSFLSRLLLTTALSLPLMTASGAGVHADIVTVQGADGANGADGVNAGDPGLPGDDGESVAADAGSLHPITFPLNKATATGGNGGAGGASFPSDPTSPQTIVSGNGGEGGAATALAATSVASGPAEAHAAAIGGNGGQVGAQFAVILGGAGSRQWRGSYRDKFCDKFGRQPVRRRCRCHEFRDWRNGWRRRDRKCQRCALHWDWR